MQKIIYLFFLFFISIIFFLIIYLSVFGVETSRFNNIIINEIKKKDNNIQLSLKSIKVKFDIKKIQIYFATLEPQITYQDIKVPIKEINLYSKIISILKLKNEINQAIISLENFSIEDIQKLAVRIKPSNFKLSAIFKLLLIKKFRFVFLQYVLIFFIALMSNLLLEFLYINDIFLAKLIISFLSNWSIK